MPDNQHFWMRAEIRPDEERAPITPEDAARLIGAGHRVSVEACRNPVIPFERHRAVGCRIVQAGSWRRAPLEAWILGLKELPDQTGPLRHRHIYFAHAFKGQSGAADLLQRFDDGGGPVARRQRPGRCRPLAEPFGRMGRHRRAVLFPCQRGGLIHAGQ